MRILGLTLIAAFLGIALGVTTTWSHFAGVTERFDLEAAHVAPPQHTHTDPHDSAVKEPLRATAGARVEVVNGMDYDFGEMERFSKRSRKFVLKNTGTVPLKLENGKTSCGACTILGDVKSELLPGESTEVLVEWKANFTETEFRKEAYILTSDPERPRVVLTIHGKVSQLILTEPTELNFGQLSQSSPAHGTVSIYSYAADDLQFGEPTLTNSSIAKFFEIEVKPVDAELLARKAGAKQGISLTVKIQPGLPLGAFTQTIRMSTNLEAIPQIEIAIQGMVGGDISIAGPGYTEKGNILTLGVVDRKKGIGKTLLLIVKGPHRQNVRVEVVSTDPADVLKAKLDAATPINDGAVIRIPLQIEIPPKSVATSRVGGKDSNDYGKIILRTTHPTIKEITILVQFAIEG